MVERIIVTFDEYFSNDRLKVIEEAERLGMIVDPNSYYYNTFCGDFEVECLDSLFSIKGVVFACPERTIESMIYNPDTGERYDT